MSKLFVDSNQFFNLSLDLAKKVVDSNFNCDVVLGISKGGCIPGIIVHEYLNYKGIKCDYSSVSVKSYDDNNIQGNNTIIDMSEYTKKQLKDKKILIVDDVFDTGNTMMCLGNYLSIIGIDSYNYEIACVYYKPNNNITTIIPDYYEQSREEWIVFPHEFMGLTEKEVEFKLKDI
tara:strand:+ start:1647 stop:2171 length:525 start_codon:yes stop_codon:yes gene_type:complete